jgi:hypothetical protein
VVVAAEVVGQKDCCLLAATVVVRPQFRRLLDRPLLVVAAVVGPQDRRFLVVAATVVGPHDRRFLVVGPQDRRLLDYRRMEVVAAVAGPQERQVRQKEADLPKSHS